MFIRMVGGALVRQWKKMIMIAFTIALGASLATAMLSVMFNVGDKVNQELKTYGANITVKPKASTVISDLYDVEGGDSADTYLKEDELGNIKTIFWTYAIIDYTPLLNTTVTTDDDEEVELVGSWFNHRFTAATQEEITTGLTNLRSWWDITDGEWLDEQADQGEDTCMVGADVASRFDLKAGDEITLTGDACTKTLKVVGVFDSGDDADDQIYAQIDLVQAITGLDGDVSTIEVSALTTPDNELAEKAAKDPGSLSVSQYETWYCTAYVSSISYQIQEVISNSVASAVRQVADSEGAILDKTRLLMLLITILAMVGSAFGICNLVTASIMERASEIGLMKAIGAQNGAITGVVLSEIFATAIMGGAVGFGVGFGFAQIIGHSVFNSSISFTPTVIPIVIVLIIAVTLFGSLSAVRMITKLQPAEVLHGK